MLHANGRDVLMGARRHLDELTRTRWSVVRDFDNAPPAVFTVVRIFAGIIVSIAVEVNAGNLQLDAAQALLGQLVGTAADLEPPID